jgi:alpha/beta superfamily hydrolase
MDNPVVQAAVAACAGAGLATLRFNFRGVGASTGHHGGGEAERRDLDAALDHLASALGSPARPVAVAGYSFGAAVAVDLVAHRPGLAGLALIAPPLAMLDGDRLAALAAFAGPLLVVAGSRDHLCPGQALAALAARCRGRSSGPSRGPITSS